MASNYLSQRSPVHVCTAYKHMFSIHHPHFSMKYSATDETFEIQTSNLGSTHGFQFNRVHCIWDRCGWWILCYTDANTTLRSGFYQAS